MRFQGFKNSKKNSFRGNYMVSKLTRQETKNKQLISYNYITQFKACNFICERGQWPPEQIDTDGLNPLHH